MADRFLHGDSYEHEPPLCEVANVPCGVEATVEIRAMFGGEWRRACVPHADAIKLAVEYEDCSCGKCPAGVEVRGIGG